MTNFTQISIVKFKYEGNTQLNESSYVHNVDTNKLDLLFVMIKEFEFSSRKGITRVGQRGEREKGRRGCEYCEGEGWVAMTPREVAKARREFNLNPYFGRPATEKPCPECLGPKMEAGERYGLEAFSRGQINIGSEVSHPSYGLGIVQERVSGGRGQETLLTVLFGSSQLAVVPEKSVKKTELHE